MKAIIPALFVAALALAPLGAAAQDAKPAKTQTKSKAAGKTKANKKVRYVCPMDGYASDKPGKCPECGMKLEKRAVKAETGKTTYVCPMDGHTSDKPGKCPKCGMALEKRTQ